MHSSITIRSARPSEYEPIGKLMVNAYSRLAGFPSPAEQPKYYQLLAQVGELVQKPAVELLVAVDEKDRLLGAVVYFGQMDSYGSGGTATKEKNAAGFRLLAVAPDTQRMGVGKCLTVACIEKAKRSNLSQLIIHTTKAMQTAWNMYEKIGFVRSPDLDFMQGNLEVFGFRLQL